MTFRRIWFFGSITLILAGLLAAAGWATAAAGISQYSVSVNTYTIGTIASSPNTAHVGDSLTISGTGFLPKHTIEVGIAGRSSTDLYYSQLMATATTDDAGNWQAKTGVPATVIRDSDKAAVPTLYGNWTLIGGAYGSDGGSYMSVGTLTVVEAASTSPTTTTTYYPASVEGSTLPSTGLPALSVWLLAAGTLAGAGFALDRWRLRRTRKRRPGGAAGDEL